MFLRILPVILTFVARKLRQQNVKKKSQSSSPRASRTSRTSRK